MFVTILLSHKTDMLSVYPGLSLITVIQIMDNPNPDSQPSIMGYLLHLSLHRVTVQMPQTQRIKWKYCRVLNIHSSYDILQ